MQGHHLHIAGDIQGDVLSGGNIEEAQSGVIFHSGSELPNGQEPEMCPGIVDLLNGQQESDRELETRVRVPS